METAKEASIAYFPLYSQFAVSYKCRNNSALKRDDVIKLLACMVTKNGEFPHTVDLNNPELTVMVEVVKVTTINPSYILSGKQD